MTSRDKSSDKHNYSLFKLLDLSLRLRPDRIIVGEIRGEESLVFLETIFVGHKAPIATIHTKSPEEVIPRIFLLAQRSSHLTIDKKLLNKILKNTLILICERGSPPIIKKSQVISEGEI